MAYPKKLRPIKNKSGYLDNHKGPKNLQKIELDGMIRFIFYTMPLPQDWERELLHLICRNKYRVKQNEEKEKHVPNENRTNFTKKKYFMKWR